MLLHLPLCEGIEDFAIEPWMTTPVQGFLMVVHDVVSLLVLRALLPLLVPRALQQVIETVDFF